jgi:4-amino-4-deoxy-L-arabinose transferase-like glycosyltransferase
LNQPALALALGAGLVACGAALRVWLLVQSGWLLEGDDALSTLMAFDILDGARPLMLKNQSYGSAWEPYAMAISYLLFGVSRVSAKLPALLGSLVLIGTTWYLARIVAGRTAAAFAALLMLLPPIYVLVLNLKPWAPYTEVILFGSISLAFAVRLAWPCRRPTSSACVESRSGTASAMSLVWRDGVWSLACGVCGGLAFWMHPLAVWYLVAAALTLLARLRGRRWLRVLPLGLLGFMLGALPFWIFNLQTHGSTLAFVLAGTSRQTADRGAVFAAWWNADLPRGAGLWHPWGPSPSVLGFVMAALIGVAIAWALAVRRRPALRPLDSVLVLLVLMPTVLVFSGFGGPALNEYGFDATGRYTPPLWSALAVVLGAALAAAWQRRRWLAIVLVVVPLGINAAGLLSIDPVQAFQSPYWDRLPVDNRPLLATLRSDGVAHVWLNHWAGQPLMFDARAQGQPLVAYDWYDVQAGGIDRFPEHLPLVERAERPAFVLVTAEVEPELLVRLRELGVEHVVRRVPPYVVVVPTSRRVHPSEVTSALDYRY